MDGYQMNAGCRGERGGDTKAKREEEAHETNPLSSRLVLGRHAIAHRHSGILATLLLLLEVLIVGHLLLLFIGHVARVHTGRPGHALRRVVTDVLGRLGGDLGTLNAVLVRGRVGRIQAGLTDKVR